MKSFNFIDLLFVLIAVMVGTIVGQMIIISIQEIVKIMQA